MHTCKGYMKKYGVSIAFNLSPLRHQLFQKVLVLAKMASRYAPKVSLYHLPLPDRYADCFSRLHSLSNEPSLHHLEILDYKKVGHTFLKIHHFKIPNTFKCFAIWGVTKKKFFFKIYFTSSIPPLPPLLVPPLTPPLPYYLLVFISPQKRGGWVSGGLGISSCSRIRHIFYSG